MLGVGLLWDGDDDDSSGVGDSTAAQPGLADGMEGLDDGPARLRFTHDSRLAEVAPPHTPVCVPALLCSLVR